MADSFGILPGAGIIPRSRRAWLYASPIVALAIVIAMAGSNRGLSGGATPAASPAASPIATPLGGSTRIIVGSITIEVTDDGFVPVHFESAVGRDVTIELINTGSRPHAFRMKEFDISIDLAPGETASVEILAPPLGEYRYTSDLPGDEDLVGTMTIFI